MPIPESFLDEIRRRIPLDALVSRRVKLAKAGRERKGLCPFHNEKSPSFHCFADHYHCYGCGAHGDHFRWTMEIEKLGFREAVERLAGEAGLDIPQDSPRQVEAAQRAKTLLDVAEAVAAEYARRLYQPEGAAALAYLRGRGLSDETIRKFRLGWSGDGFRGGLSGDITPEQLLAVGAMTAGDEGRPPKNLFFGRVMFPITDRRGRVIAFGGRTLGDGQPKYVNSPETELFKKRRTLYGLDQARDALRGAARLAVVEGYMDVIALAQAGHGAAVAPLGTALTDEHLAELWRLHPEPVLCFDGDAAGARAAERSMTLALPALAPGKSLAIALLPPGEDPDSFLRRRSVSEFTALLDKAAPLSRALFHAVRRPAPDETPEARAAQRAKLDALADTIPDPTLRAEYRRTFRDLYFGAMRVKGGKPGAALRAPRPVLDEANIRARRERQILARLLASPALLALRVEALAELAFLDAASDRMRGKLVAHADDLFGLDTAGVLDQLRHLGSAADVESVLATGLSDLLRAMKADADPGEALLALDELIERLSLDRLQHEVAASVAAAAQDFSPEAARRVQATKQARDAALSGPDPDNITAA
jgi:DNA primase